jgi:hypothetical protein
LNYLTKFTDSKYKIFTYFYTFTGIVFKLDKKVFIAESVSRPPHHDGPKIDVPRVLQTFPSAFPNPPKESRSLPNATAPCRQESLQHSTNLHHHAMGLYKAFCPASLFDL